MPKGLCAKINLDSWLVPEIFTWLAEAGPIKEAEMLRTFNCGIGMVIFVDPHQKDAILSALESEGETAIMLGKVTNTGQVRYSGSLW